MNINDFVRNDAAARALAYGSVSATASSSTSKLSGAAQAGLNKASQRIQAQVDTTTTQLSALGKLKSAVASVQTSAQGLSQLATTAPNTPPASATAIKTALANFVKAFNDASTAASGTPGKSGDTASALAAARVARDLGKAVSADPATAAALKKVGVSVSPQGRLALDSAKFEVAQTSDAAGVRASLAKIGQQLDATTTQELAQSGNVGSALASLNQTATVLKNQKAALASLGQSAGTGSTLQRLGSLGFGLATYQNS